MDESSSDRLLAFGAALNPHLAPLLGQRQRAREAAARERYELLREQEAQRRAHSAQIEESDFESMAPYLGQIHSDPESALTALARLQTRSPRGTIALGKMLELAQSEIGYRKQQSAFGRIGEPEKTTETGRFRPSRTPSPTISIPPMRVELPQPLELTEPPGQTIASVYGSATKPIAPEWRPEVAGPPSPTLSPFGTPRPPPDVFNIGGGTVQLPPVGKADVTEQPVDVLKPPSAGTMLERAEREVLTGAIPSQALPGVIGAQERVAKTRSEMEKTLGDRKLLEQTSQSLGLTPKDLATPSGLLRLASTLLSQGRNDLAEELYKRAKDIPATATEENRGVATAELNRALSAVQSMAPTDKSGRWDPAVAVSIANAKAAISGYSQGLIKYEQALQSLDHARQALAVTPAAAAAKAEAVGGTKAEKPLKGMFLTPDGKVKMNPTAQEKEEGELFGPLNAPQIATWQSVPIATQVLRNMSTVTPHLMKGSGNWFIDAAKLLVYAPAMHQQTKSDPKLAPIRQSILDAVNLTRAYGQRGRIPWAEIERTSEAIASFGVTQDVARRQLQMIYNTIRENMENLGLPWKDEWNIPVLQGGTAPGTGLTPEERERREKLLKKKAS